MSMQYKLRKITAMQSKLEKMPMQCKLRINNLVKQAWNNANTVQTWIKTPLECIVHYECQWKKLYTFLVFQTYIKEKLECNMNSEKF